MERITGTTGQKRLTAGSGLLLYLFFTDYGRCSFMNWTEEQYKEYMENRTKRPPYIVRRRNPRRILMQPDTPDNASDTHPANPKGVAKYRNDKITVDGHVFDSKREAIIYNGLKISEESGVIHDLELQPRFVLQPSFKDKNGKTQRAITYVADFRYKEKDGHVVVVDVKSKITEANPVYRLKRKMLQYHFPDIDFREMF